jgi:hypothetical protein
LKEDIEIDFEEFINTYNKKGRKEAQALAREKYNLSFQQIRRRLNNRSDYYFDTRIRQYKHKSETSIESNFMTIDELGCCKNNENPIKDSMPLSGLGLTQSFDDLLKDLIKDRLMELNKYVSINLQERRLIINTKNLKRDCVELIEI